MLADMLAATAANACRRLSSSRGRGRGGDDECPGNTGAWAVTNITPARTIADIRQAHYTRSSPKSMTLNVENRAGSAWLRAYGERAQRFHNISEAALTHQRASALSPKHQQGGAD
jgi:hypothetical protein